MKYVVKFNKTAKSQLKKLEKSIANRIVGKLEWFINTGKPLKYSKKLNNPVTGIYRFRIGNYRALFDVDNNGNITIIYILAIKHRKRAYF